ncbi:exported hypothetical protein [Paraburkholderia piptadeniae]|uniref:Secreted protein n=1 Tax=Paraburkholderia piptadeniae TaxID=1701573 RepID=A0A1N7SVT5_9BURK|nr:exported hypothetical protein [Paraburkholderia piptadeniae]
MCMCFVVLCAGAGVVAAVAGAVAAGAVAAGADAWANATVANSDVIKAAASFFIGVSSGGKATNHCVVHRQNASGPDSLTSGDWIVLGTVTRLS